MKAARQPKPAINVPATIPAPAVPKLPKMPFTARIFPVLLSALRISQGIPTG